MSLKEGAAGHAARWIVKNAQPFTKGENHNRTYAGGRWVC